MPNPFSKERHITPKSMVLEALEEHLFTVDWLLRYKKIDPQMWKNANGGTLGYPAALILFTIVDTIGSYYRKSDLKLEITVEGTKRVIDEDGYKHFFILNSHYFNLSLSAFEIQNLYNMVRSKLVHNSIIGAEITLTSLSSIPFVVVQPSSGKGKYEVHLSGFLSCCKHAVNLFSEQADEIFAATKLGKGFPRMNGKSSNSGSSKQ